MCSSVVCVSLGTLSGDQSMRQGVCLEHVPHKLFVGQGKIKSPRGHAITASCLPPSPEQRFLLSCSSSFSVLHICPVFDWLTGINRYSVLFLGKYIGLLFSVEVPGLNLL